MMMSRQSVSICSAAVLLLVLLSSAVLVVVALPMAVSVEVALEVAAAMAVPARSSFVGFVVVVMDLAVVVVAVVGP